jgi:carbamoyl-phosphate synthase large subunit
MMGATLEELGLTTEVIIEHWAVKEAVFPFDRFDNVDVLLGPEMKSTGEVMGIDNNLGLAIAKSHLAAGAVIPSSGNVFLSVRDGDKASILQVAKDLIDLGFTISATTGTAAFLKNSGITCTLVNKISQGRPHILDKMQDDKIAWIVNTSLGLRTTEDSYRMRRAALDYRIPYTTTATGAAAQVKGMQALKTNSLDVNPVQYFT